MSPGTLLKTGLPIIKRANFVIEALDLDQDWPGVKRLIEIEEWPFIRADLEVSCQQPRSTGLVARDPAQHGVIAFLLLHHFENVGYLDMTIVDPAYRRNPMLSHQLWKRAQTAMQQSGFTSQVTHCTRATGRIASLAGYCGGLEFQLLRRNEQGGTRHATPPRPLTREELPALIQLDAEVFGVAREHWWRALAEQPTSRLLGRFDGDRLAASVCLRERRENTLCIDACNARAFDALRALLDDILNSFPHKRLECFARQGSDLEHYLSARDFHSPDFFEKLKPLIEFRAGNPHAIGTGPSVRTLSWF